MICHLIAVVVAAIATSSVDVFVWLYIPLNPVQSYSGVVTTIRFHLFFGD